MPNGWKHEPKREGDAFAPADTVVQAVYLPLSLLVVPAHGSAIFAFVTHMILRNTIGHGGVELMPRVVLRWLRWQPITAVTHRDLHHSECAGTSASISRGGIA